MEEIKVDSVKNLLRFSVYDFARPIGENVIAMHVFRELDDKRILGALYQLALHHLADITVDTRWQVCVDRMPVDYTKPSIQCFDWFPMQLVRKDIFMQES